MNTQKTNAMVLWKILAEIEVEPGDLGNETDYTKGFMNVIVWGASETSARDRLSQYLESFTWRLLSVPEVERVDESKGYGEDVLAMVERARQNPKAIILGCFHSYREGL